MLTAHRYHGDRPLHQEGFGFPMKSLIFTCRCDRRRPFSRRGLAVVLLSSSFIRLLPAQTDDWYHVQTSLSQPPLQACPWSSNVHAEIQEEQRGRGHRKVTKALLFLPLCLCSALMHFWVVSNIQADKLSQRKLEQSCVVLDVMPSHPDHEGFHLLSCQSI